MRCRVRSLSFLAAAPLALALFLLPQVTSLATVEAADSRFERTITALQVADDDARSRFASVALLELAETYLAEADLARSEADSSEQAQRLVFWSRAVGRYAEGLVALVAAIDQGMPVALRLNEREVPSVSVDGRTVMLAHPRSDQQAGYEQRVLKQFCTGITCTALTAARTAQPIPVSPQLVTPDWEFSELGPRCHYRGLSVQFRAPGRLAAQKSICQQFMQEVEMLATEIAWQQRHGVFIEWDAIRIQASPGQPAHLVRLNSSDDSLLLSLPIISSSNALPGAIAPWLQQRFAPAGPPSIVIDASEQGWD